MNLNDIIERFTMVSGMSMGEVTRYLPLIADCKAYFEERIGGGLSCVQRRRVAHACAVYAYYRVSMLMRDGGAGSFKAGDVQITSAGLAEQFEAAQRMWNEERAVIADIDGFDDAFAFRSVRV